MNPQQALQTVNAALASEFCFLNESTRQRIVAALQVLQVAIKPKEGAEQDVKQPEE